MVQTVRGAGYRFSAIRLSADGVRRTPSHER